MSNDSVIMCLPKRNAEVYSQRFFGSNDELMFCKREEKKDYENQTKTMKRCNLKRCYFGSLNVRTLRIKRTINSGKLQCINEHKNGTEILFDIDFEIENKFLNIVMTKSFQFGLDKIADAFQKRAENLFGKSKN